MLKFLKRIGSKWWLVLLLVVTVLLNVAADFFLPFQLGQIIKDIQNPNSLGSDLKDIDIFYQVIYDAFIMLLIAVISGISGLATCKIASTLSAHIVSKSRYELFKKTGEFSMAEMNKFSVSSLVTRVTNDLTFVGNAFGLFFRYILYGPLVAISAIILLLIEKIWALTIAIFVALIIMLIFIFVLVKITLPKYEAIQSKLDKVNLVTRENLEGLRVVRAYNAEDFQEKKFSLVNLDLMITERFSNRSLGLLIPGIQLIVGLLNVSIYLIASYLVPAEQMPYPSLSVAVQFASLILMGFILMTIIIIQLPRCMVCAKRVNEVIDTKISVVGKDQDVQTDEVGTIEFRNVSFSYPGAEKPVLENISFKVKKGETIAFIGATGAGKTTLINLMPRFFDCTEGEVLIDGVNVKEYRTEDLNSRFGYVPQRGYLFHDSLVNNVTIGKPEATPVQINRALDIAQASEFVSKLPDGLNYEISQGGKNVSGGQRQRLCIARAIIMEPEIFIFDDSFSALDYRTDKIVRGEIKKQCVGTTSVIVAQRVGTIMDADQIVVLDYGRMVGIGKHADLLKTCDVYREIALSQLSKEELENGAK